MATLALGRYKAETESRLAEEKRLNERRRNLIVLIEKYLLSLGYLDTVTKLETESTISLDKWDVADNLDLYMILTEYEEFFEMKFSKPAKLVRKLGENSAVLPKIQKKGSASLVSAERKSKKDEKKPPLSSNNIKQDNNSATNTTNNTENLIEITGNAIQSKKKEQEDENFYENRVLKAIPQELLDIPDLKDLAQYLQRDICIENPNVRFSDIVGLETAKGLLKEAVLLPLKYPHFFTGLLEPWKGVLLFGPPGTGKTMLAKAVATECKTTFFNISASSIVSKWRGDSEKLVRVLFELARFHQPSTIFLDELDSIMSQRNSVGMEHEGSRRMKTELLIQLDGLIKNKERVFLLAASNLPWDLDVAMLRRLEKRILVPLPELKSRESMLQKFLPPGTAEDLDYLELAKKLENYSGSDIRLVCKEAAMKPVRRIMKQLEEINLDVSGNNEPQIKKIQVSNKTPQEKIMPGPVVKNDVEEAVLTTKATLLLSTEKYVKWEKEFGST